MTGIKDIVEAIAAAMETAGFKPTKEVFSFDAVPDSTIDRSFRVETRADSADYQMMEIREANETVSVWIAYKAKRDANAVRGVALAEREAIERLILNDDSLAGLDCNPIVLMASAEMSDYQDQYFVSKIDFSVNYVQSIA